MNGLRRMIHKPFSRGGIYRTLCSSSYNTKQIIKSTSSLLPSSSFQKSSLSSLSSLPTSSSSNFSSSSSSLFSPMNIKRHSLLNAISDHNTPNRIQHRCLHLHEYQSMDLLRSYNIPVPKGKAVSSAEETAAMLAEWTSSSSSSSHDFVVKAQVLAGGRGLGHFLENPRLSGIKICGSLAEVESTVAEMLGKTLVTAQTGAEGKRCGTVLVAERFYIRREKYLAVVVDRGAGGPLLIGSSVGGSSIEEISKKYPESIVRLPVDLSAGLSPSAAENFCLQLGFEADRLPEAAACVQNLVALLMEKDCTLVEVNPLVETHDGRILACDAKLNFDDSADFRHKDIFALRDQSQEDPREVAAHQYSLNYIALQGNIGCMVNGAGLAMATLDMLKLWGGEPANFLDIGGGADSSQVLEALRILQDDINVKVIFINIFGGIMRCDTISLGLIKASQQLKLSKPLVVRLVGTNQDLAKDLLDSSGLKMTFTPDFEEASKKAVKITQILKLAEQASIDVSFDI